MTTYQLSASLMITDGDPPLVLRDGVPVPTTTVLRDLAERLLLVLQQDPCSALAQRLSEQVVEETVRSSLYHVSSQTGRYAFDGTMVRERPPELGRDRLVDDLVCHVDLRTDTMSVEEALIRACQVMAPHSLLGVKARSSCPSAVFLPGPFERGLVDVFGHKIAEHVLSEDRLDRLQLLTILCHREGQRPCKDVSIRLPVGINDSEHFDGLIADLDLAAWSDLLDVFNLPGDVTWMQVTILDRDHGLATKGALRRCPPNQEPALYSSSWKIGLPSGSVPSASILLMETDRTYSPSASLNLQQVVYNFNPEEQQQLLDQVFIPAVLELLRYRWTSRFRSIDRLLAAGANLHTEPVCRRVNHLRRKLAMDGLHRTEVPGIRRKVAPDPTLEPLTVKVPRGSFRIGEWVDVTRDPSLPVGNSTQRYKVVGHSQGNVIEVGPMPWMNVQGGDFDGDDACLQQVTLDLFPNKEFDQTPVGMFREAKLSYRHGVRDPVRRFHQALLSLDRPIGSNDLLARRLLEEGRLDEDARLMLSRCIQNAIDSAKHAVSIVEHGYEAPGEHAIDAIRSGDLDSDAIPGSLYGPLVAAARHVIDQDLQPEPFNPTPIRLAWATMAATFPSEALVRVSTFAGQCQERFVELCRRQPTERQMDMLSDCILVSMEKAVKVLEGYVNQTELCRTCMEIGLLHRASLHLAARVVRMKTLRTVFAGSEQSLREVLAGC